MISQPKTIYKPFLKVFGFFGVYCIYVKLIDAIKLKMKKTHNLIFSQYANNRYESKIQFGLKIYM